jgi:hypothetical protein
MLRRSGYPEAIPAREYCIDGEIGPDGFYTYTVSVYAGPYRPETIPNLIKSAAAKTNIHKSPEAELPKHPWKKRVEIGDCTLYQGDCIEILHHIEGVDSVVTDAPYGIAYKSGHATDALWGEKREIAHDQTVDARDAVIKWAGDRPQLHFGTWRAPRPPSTRQVLIWDKKGALGMGALDIPWKPDHEEIYVIGKGFVGKRDCGSVIPCAPVQSMAKNGRQHPTERLPAGAGRISDVLFQVLKYDVFCDGAVGG